MLAKEAVALLPHLPEGLIVVRPGIFASDDADGRVTLLLSGEATARGGDVADQPGPVALTSAVAHCLDTLRWLESLDVHATAAVGHGLGALAGLAWAGVLGESEVVEIADLRAQFLLRSGARADMVAATLGTASAGAPWEPSGAVALRAAIAQRFRFGPPRRRLISTLTGAEIESVDDAIDLICSGFAGAERVADAVADGAIGATLLVETGPGRTLASAAEACRVPAISLQSGFADPMHSARVAAALFAAGALGQPKPLFAGRPARPVDIWREQVFITNPCEVTAAADEPATDLAAAEHHISSKRGEFERRLPVRPLTAAAAPVAAADPQHDEAGYAGADVAVTEHAAPGLDEPAHDEAKHGTHEHSEAAELR